MAKRSRGITLTAKPLTVTQAAAAIDALKGKPPMTPAEARLITAAMKLGTAGEQVDTVGMSSDEWLKITMKFSKAVAAVVKERRK
jgi:hypothetical protein